MNALAPSMDALAGALRLPAILGNVPISAEGLGFWAFLTNSVLVAAIICGVIVFFARRATRKMTIIPHRSQNAFEAVVEFLYEHVRGIVGARVAPHAFPLIGALFLYILVANWFGLIPGIGTIGLNHEPNPAPLTIPPNAHFTPLLRPATADLNMTLGISIVAMVLWFVITMRISGPVEFLKHMFAPKGGTEGVPLPKVALAGLKVFLIVVFAFVGLIEVISIVFRPVSLSLRLFGNVYAGETLLHQMMSLGDKIVMGGSILTTIPFYFMELLVGLLQAMVFSLLCAVYIQLSTAETHH